MASKADRIQNLARFRQIVLSRLPQAAKDRLHKANDKNADEFMALVEQAIPPGDNTRPPHLIETLAKSPTEGSEIGVTVTIGGPAAPYPLHLEVGHRGSGGVHVPAKPAWFPAKRVIRKRAKSRAARAMTDAVKAVKQGN